MRTRYLLNPKAKKSDVEFFVRQLQQAGDSYAHRNSIPERVVLILEAYTAMPPEAPVVIKEELPYG